MTNNWISRVMGTAPLTEAAAPELSDNLRRVLGEADQEPESKEKPEKAEEKKPEPKKETPPAPATDKAEPDEDKPEAAVDADIETGADASADSNVDSQTVEHLVSSWQSGSRMDVASQLMYTPVSYVDFVKMVLRIGEQDAVELGGMLDELSAVRPSIDQPGSQGGEAPATPEAPEQPGSASRVLSRIAQRRAAHPAPAGDTAPELDTAP